MTTPDYVDHYREAFDAFEASREGDPDWMRDLRRRAFARFEELRLPHRKVEEWKYTSLRGFAKERFRPSSAREEALDSQRSEASARLAFSNGQLALGKSDLGSIPAEVAIRPLGEAWDQAKESLESIYDSLDNGVAALGAAFLSGGAVIDIGRNAALDAPLEVVTQTAGADSFASTAVLVFARRHSEATVVERVSSSDGPSFTTNFTTLSVEDGARLEHVIDQRIDNESYRYGLTRGTVGRDAQLHTFSASIGATLSRDDLDLYLGEEGGHIDMTAVYLGEGTQHIDHWTEVDHAVAHTTSDQLYKTVLDGHSHGVFNGKVIVRRDAQKISAEQLNNNLLLTDDARIDTRPQLEIAADDVTCGHGATIGQINEEELFYMESRGVARDAARVLLVNGFAAEAIERIANPAVRDSLLSDVSEILRSRL